MTDHLARARDHAEHAQRVGDELEATTALTYAVLALCERLDRLDALIVPPPRPKAEMALVRCKCGYESRPGELVASLGRCPGCAVQLVPAPKA